MTSHIVIDGNAFYEVDEECMKRMNAREGYGRKTKEEEEKKNKSDGQKKGAL